MKNFNRNMAWLFALLALVVGMVIGANLPNNAPTTNEYKLGFDDGYNYAVKTARLITDDGTTYVIVYGDNDGNEYSR
jgi:hydrogenase/urease accessory protein HupE